ncbi:MAG: beta-glucuronidase [Promethearchaeota archaeon Loki_b31]|nr:MAG: beta-glucuronidase [Candidatus Lokiarchaeota archaeon Loki_b31]
MLYPQRNKYRQFIELSGFWDFRFDINNKGLDENWKNGFNNSRPIAVPASWNDQFAEGRDNLGPGWYQKSFSVPCGWEEHRIILRFGSVNYLAEIWLNGEWIGKHEGGHLPFEFDIGSFIKPHKNILVIRVEGNLSKAQVPPGKVRLNYPSTNFDFFPFCGIHRPVLLYSVPNYGIDDITVTTSIEGNNGCIFVNLSLNGEKEVEIHLLLKNKKNNVLEKRFITNRTGRFELTVNNALFWDPTQPNLYDLDINLLYNEKTYDSYTIPIGIRTITVEGDKLLLNGKPIVLKGFGRHEDFPITGRGYVPAVIIKDYSLMKWIGANSFRTSHYPYSEQMMDLADRLGFLIIDEIPAVGLTFEKRYLDHHLELCQQYVKELITRDKNHPSVIMWSLANEPHSSLKSKEFFQALYDKTKELDGTRPITVVNMMGVKERAFEFCDILCLNRYYGWYTEQGRIQEGCEILSNELDKLYKKYQKPIILTEFGADAIPGWHAQPIEMFSEEYQVELLKSYIEVLNEKQFVVGQHIWNLCDFKTSQEVIRMGSMNYKGVFTRDRRPKMAAHLLHRLWKGEEK